MAKTNFGTHKKSIPFAMLGLGERIMRLINRPPTSRSAPLSLIIMKALLVLLLVVAISACAPTVPADKYNSDIATANAEISIATAIIQSFSANATVIAARLYTAEACIEVLSSTTETGCEMALPTSTSISTPTLPASTSTLILSPVARSSLAPFSTPAPASPVDGQRTYSDPEYGFSIRYPARLDILMSKNVPSLYLGEKIQVVIYDFDPLDCRGDCPLVESIAPATIAGLNATKDEGYIGAVGGEIPQRYLQYILKHNNRYYTFTLWALDRAAKNECCSVIYPLDENDVVLFEQILDTLTFEN